ncbi:hypothetical protein BURMUCGD1_3567 [Burkholderia multivorans CGD1]|nr:hypothetical protein BURMUCGD1_3567 [Burkholderia multivorans CGD1]
MNGHRASKTVHSPGNRRICLTPSPRRLSPCVCNATKSGAISDPNLGCPLYTEGVAATRANRAAPTAPQVIDPLNGVVPMGSNSHD